MKRKRIYRIFIILLCLGCLFGCKADGKKPDEKEAEERIILHAGEGAWEMEFIWEGAENILWERQIGSGEEIPLEEQAGSDKGIRSERQMQPDRYIYDSLSAEEYLKRESASGPEVLIANSRLGYKISLGTGESYQMRSGDRLFLKRSSDVEIYAGGLRIERKSCDCGKDICEVYREYGNWLNRTLEQGRELLFYQCSRQKGKLYITYF